MPKAKFTMFSAGWCRQCPATKAALGGFAGNEIEVEIVDIDSGGYDVAAIKSVPTVILVVDGQRVAEYGTMTRRQVRKALEDHGVLAS